MAMYKARKRAHANRRERLKQERNVRHRRAHPPHEDQLNAMREQLGMLDRRRSGMAGFISPLRIIALSRTKEGQQTVSFPAAGEEKDGGK